MIDCILGTVRIFGRVALLGALVGVLFVHSGRPGAAAPAVMPQTLITASSEIDGFAQDGRQIAWVTRGGRCTHRLHLRVLGSRRTVRVGGAAGPNNPNWPESETWLDGAGLALADGRALWDVSHNLSSNVWSLVSMRTASLQDPRVRRLPCCEWRHDVPSRPYALPRAGSGGVLVYYSHRDTLDGEGDTRYERAVRRVVGAKTKKLFDVDRPLDLDVDRGRIALARRELRRGDGCGCNFTPVWSRDGTKIAFLRTDDAPSEREGYQYPAEITVMNADGTGRTSVTSDHRARWTLDWSNDGTKFVYGYETYDAHLVDRIAVVNADGSGSRAIAEGKAPSWSPSGSEIAFETRGPRGPQVSVVDADGTGLRHLGAGESPSWSPNGRRIAFIRNDALFVMRADGTGARRIVPRGKSPHEPTWSPDGRRIAFLSYLPSGIFRVNADGSALKRLTRTGADGAPDWSPDGHRLVFSSGRDDLVPDETDESEIFVINADNGRGLRPLTFTRGDEWQSVGQIRSARGRILASFESKGTPHAVVLSGSLAAVLTQLVTGAKHIALFAARSGELRGLVPVLRDSAAPLAANDRWVVFAVGRSIRGINVRTRAKRLLARASGTPIGLSISGRRVAWAENTRGRGRVRAFLLPR